jgi:hypothetical protein
LGVPPKMPVMRRMNVDLPQPMGVDDDDGVCFEEGGEGGEKRAIASLALFSHSAAPCAKSNSNNTQPREMALHQPSIASSTASSLL